MEETGFYEYWLFTARGLGSTSLRRITGLMKPQEIYENAACLPDEVKACLKASQLESLRRHADENSPKQEWEHLCGSGFAFTTLGAADYPKALANIPDPPFGLVYGGKLPAKGKALAALIGARDCTEYGRAMARRLGQALAEAGIAVISGMARGIDGVCQEAALRAGGYSLGVLGCGADICYPESNRGLYEMLLDRGGVLSEYPLGTGAKPGLFPLRNRIISGLSDCVIVIEARERSGTIITVDQALEQGRDVYVVPGRVTDPLSAGCNQLIHQGAEVVMSVPWLVDRILERCGQGADSVLLTEGAEGAHSGKTQEHEGKPQEHARKPQEHARKPQEHMDSFSELEREICAVLDYEPRGIEEIMMRIKCRNDPPVSAVMAALTRLCLRNAAGQEMGKYYRR